ncbi:hypothetical protein D3C87_1058340 [compost metagenome]
MAQLQNSVTASQCDKILSWLKAGNPLTAIGALDKFGCNRLAARIADLRKVGHEISSTRIVVFNREGSKCHVAEYRLAGAGGAV